MEYCKIHTDDSTLIVAIMNIWETTERGENLEIRIEKMEDMDTYTEFTYLPITVITPRFSRKQN